MQKSIEELKEYPHFSLADPAFKVDVVRDQKLILKGKQFPYDNIEQMIAKADFSCEKYEKHIPPSSVSLFLMQFQDRFEMDKDLGYQDMLYALGMLHADKNIGVNCCAAAVHMEPLEADEMPDGGELVQYRAIWYLTHHIWEKAAYKAQSLLHSQNHDIIWFEEPLTMLIKYVQKNHHNVDDFFAQDTVRANKPDHLLPAVKA